ncbi:hypothetical protein KUCAC02_019876, partial [Chaenocephalus aceratus]
GLAGGTVSGGAGFVCTAEAYFHLRLQQHRYAWFFHSYVTFRRRASRGAGSLCAGFIEPQRCPGGYVSVTLVLPGASCSGPELSANHSPVSSPALTKLQPPLLFISHLR